MRHNRHPDRTPIQQSMTIEPEHYTALNLHSLMLGIVLEVHLADDPQNYSAQQTNDRRGFLHEATVLVLRDGTSTYMVLDHVVITPDVLSGLDDYEERLPRGCAGLVHGGEMTPTLAGVNPYDLDGDWCVIAYLGGIIDRPFIVRYWPHPRNTRDPATSGMGNPNSSGQGQALTQSRRYFRRINGVEYIVNRKGDLYISTALAGSRLRLNSPAEQGRNARLNSAQGGSVRVFIKPSQSVELTFDPPEDGIGVLDRADPDLPQSNPRPSAASYSGTRNNTFLKIDKDSAQIIVPSAIIARSKRRIEVTSDEDTTLTVGGKLTTNVTGNTSATLTGMVDLIGQSTVTLTVSGALSASAASISLAAGTGSIGISGGMVDLGAPGGLPLVNNAWVGSWTAAMGVLSAAVTAAPPVPTPVSNLALIVAIQTALTSMNAALAAALTIQTRAT